MSTSATSFYNSFHLSLITRLMFQPGPVLPSGQHSLLYILILFKAVRLYEYAQQLARSEHELESPHTPTCECCVESRVRCGGWGTGWLAFLCGLPLGYSVTHFGRWPSLLSSQLPLISQQIKHMGENLSKNLDNVAALFINYQANWCVGGMLTIHYAHLNLWEMVGFVTRSNCGLFFSPPRYICSKSTQSIDFMPHFFLFTRHALLPTQPWNTIPLCHLHKLVRSFLQVSVTYSRKCCGFRYHWGHARRGTEPHEASSLLLCKITVTHLQVNNSDWTHPCDKVFPDSVKMNLNFKWTLVLLE